MHPVRLNPQPFDHESSTLPLNHQVPHCTPYDVQLMLKARFFLLFDLRELFFRFRVGGTKNK